MSLVRGIRGATTIEQDTPEDVIEATGELLQEIVVRNRVEPDQIAAVIFTITPDICSEFPAVAARRMGWNYVPLLCFQEMEVKGAIPRCIRVLVLWNTGMSQEDIRHVYLRRASSLRADLCE